MSTFRSKSEFILEASFAHHFELQCSATHSHPLQSSWPGYSCLIASPSSWMISLPAFPGWSVRNQSLAQGTVQLEGTPAGDLRFLVSLTTCTVLTSSCRRNCMAPSKLHLCTVARRLRQTPSRGRHILWWLLLWWALLALEFWLRMCATTTNACPWSRRKRSTL